jgi:hypothetical protein
MLLASDMTGEGGTAELLDFGVCRPRSDTLGEAASMRSLARRSISFRLLRSLRASAAWSVAESMPWQSRVQRGIGGGGREVGRGPPHLYHPQPHTSTPAALCGLGRSGGILHAMMRGSTNAVATASRIVFSPVCRRAGSQPRFAENRERSRRTFAPRRRDTHAPGTRSSRHAACALSATSMLYFAPLLSMVGCPRAMTCSHCRSHLGARF